MPQCARVRAQTSSLTAATLTPPRLLVCLSSWINHQRSHLHQLCASDSPDM